MQVSGAIDFILLEILSASLITGPVKTESPTILGLFA